MKSYAIQAHWDAEDRIWWTESKDAQGLVAEAATVEMLHQVLKENIPGLVRLDLEPYQFGDAVLFQLVIE
jgi:hypothetical protein